jgi:glycosyltransferase involved in cell wall biosynthesis
MTKHKRDIYFFSVSKTTGGIDTYIKTLTESFEYSNLYNVKLFTCKYIQDVYWKYQNIDLFTLDFISIFGLKRLYHFIRKKIIKPGNIIHANDMITAFYGIICWLILFGRIRIIITIHSILGEHNVFKNFGRRFQNFIMQLFVIMVNVFPVRIISVSWLAKKDLVSLGIRSDRINVVYHGIVLDNNYTFHQKSSNVGFIGRLSMEKGIDLFLALANLLYSSKNIFIYGPAVNNDLSQYQDKNRNIYFCGYIRNKNIIYDKVDIVCITSRTESFCFVLLESLFRKKPVYSFDLPVVREILNECKFLRDEIICSNVYEMAEKILDCDLMKWDFYFGEYYNYLVETYSVERFINNTIECYE